jgi:hypothetical protein
MQREGVVGLLGGGNFFFVFFVVWRCREGKGRIGGGRKEREKGRERNAKRRCGWVVGRRRRDIIIIIIWRC